MSENTHTLLKCSAVHSTASVKEAKKAQKEALDDYLKEQQKSQMQEQAIRQANQKMADKMADVRKNQCVLIPTHRLIPCICRYYVYKSIPHTIQTCTHACMHTLGTPKC